MPVANSNYLFCFLFFLKESFHTLSNFLSWIIDFGALECSHSLSTYFMVVFLASKLYDYSSFFLLVWWTILTQRQMETFSETLFLFEKSVASTCAVSKSVCGWVRDVTLFAESQILKVLKPNENVLHGSQRLSLRKELPEAPHECATLPWITNSTFWAFIHPHSRALFHLQPLACSLSSASAQSPLLQIHISA